MKGTKKAVDVGQADTTRSRPRTTKKAKPLPELKLPAPVEDTSRGELILARNELWTYLIDSEATEQSVTNGEYYVLPSIRTLPSVKGKKSSLRGLPVVNRDALQYSATNRLLEFQTTQRGGKACYSHPPKASRESLELNIELINAILASTMGPDFAHDIRREDDRVRFVGLLYHWPKSLPEEKLEKLLDDRNKPVFIIGAPRSGKTYTALYLLFRQYLAGDYIIVPRVNPTDADLRAVSRSIDDLHLGPNRRKWIFVEDPFGTSQFQERNLGYFVQFLRECDKRDVKPILTSREGIWHKVQSRMGANHLDELLRDCDIKLSETRSLGNTSPIYDKSTLVEMVVDYATIFGADWTSNVKSLKAVETFFRKASDKAVFFPADIVLYTALVGKEYDHKRLIKFFERTSQATSALASDLLEDLRCDELLSLMIPQILFVNWYLGSLAASFLGVDKEWNSWKENRDKNHVSLLDEGLIPTPVGSPASTLKACRLFNDVYAEAMSRICMDNDGVALLWTRLVQRMQREKAHAEIIKLGKQVIPLILELFRFVSMRKIGLAKSFETRVLEDGQASTFSNRPLEKELLRKLDKLVEEALPGDQKCAQATTLLIRITNQLLSGQVETEVRKQLKDRIVEASPEQMAVIGQGLAELVRATTPTPVFKNFALEVIDSLFEASQACNGIGLESALRYSLMLGAITEPLGEIPAFDLILLEKVKNIQVSVGQDLTAQLTWIDICIWKIANGIRYLADESFEIESIVRQLNFQHIGTVSSSLYENLKKTKEELFLCKEEEVRLYSKGWTLFSLAWHNDWCIKAGNQPTGLVRHIAEPFKQCWNDLYELFRTADDKQKQQLLSGIFDNLAYHALYHQYQASEWAKRIALRARRDAQVRIGSRFYCERGLLSHEHGDEELINQQLDFWQEIWKEARRFADRQTWEQATGSSKDVPLSCLQATTFVLACRLASHAVVEGKSTSRSKRSASGRSASGRSASERSASERLREEFQQWLIGELNHLKDATEEEISVLARREKRGSMVYNRIHKSKLTADAMWSIVFELIHQGFPPLVGAYQSLSTSALENASSLWRLRKSDTPVSTVFGVNDPVESWLHTTKQSLSSSRGDFRP